MKKSLPRRLEVEVGLFRFEGWDLQKVMKQTWCIEPINFKNILPRRVGEEEVLFYE
jgi:hypothetical protein